MSNARVLNKEFYSNVYAEASTAHEALRRLAAELELNHADGLVETVSLVPYLTDAEQSFSAYAVVAE